MEIVETFDVKLSFEVRVNEEGDISTVCVKKSIDKTNFKATEKKTSKKVSNESPNPTLTLESNKYCLNQAAVELMNVNPGDKLDIKYEKQGSKYIPVIGNDESFGTHNGNVVSKSMTVACRGTKNQELSKYGNEFLVIPHESKVGVFILQDKNAQIIEEDEDLDPFADLQNIIDENVTEVDTSIFKL